MTWMVVANVRSSTTACCRVPSPSGALPTIGSARTDRTSARSWETGSLTGQSGQRLQASRIASRERRARSAKAGSVPGTG